MIIYAGLLLFAWLTPTKILDATVIAISSENLYLRPGLGGWVFLVFVSVTVCTFVISRHTFPIRLFCDRTDNIWCVHYGPSL